MNIRVYDLCRINWTFNSTKKLAQIINELKLLLVKCIFRIIPARYLGNCRPHQNGEANYAEGYLKADRQDIL